MIMNATLERLWPHASQALRAGIVTKAPSVFQKYGMDQPLIVAHFMAQISHECGAGTEIVENLNYSAKGLVSTWPKRFPSLVAAAPYAHKPQLIANKVYDGRMGNRPGSNDGWLFRGRGGTNCTGHDGYYKLALKMAIDLLSDPDKVNEPDIFLECAVVDYILCGCLPFAKRDDIRGETHHLNGGYIGLAQRTAWLKRWKVALAAEHGEDAVTLPPRPADGTLAYGDKGLEVKGLQQSLSEKGYSLGAIDGNYDEATRDAVSSLQASAGLPSTGIVDQATKAAIESEPPKPIPEERATATADDLRDKGSETVATADSISLTARVKQIAGAGLLAGGGGEQLGVFDNLQGALDKADQAKGIWGRVHDYVAPLFGHPGILVAGALLLIGGYLIERFAKQIIANRVADHQSAAHMGR